MAYLVTDHGQEAHDDTPRSHSVDVHRKLFKQHAMNINTTVINIKNFQNFASFIINNLAITKN